MKANLHEAGRTIGIFAVVLLALALSGTLAGLSIPNLATALLAWLTVLAGTAGLVLWSRASRRHLGQHAAPARARDRSTRSLAANQALVPADLMMTRMKLRPRQPVSGR